MKKRVKIGEEIKFQVRVIDTKARFLLTVVVLALSSLMLVGAVIYDMTYGIGFEHFSYVWGVVGPIFGVVGGYFYKKST